MTYSATCYPTQVSRSTTTTMCTTCTTILIATWYVVFVNFIKISDVEWHASELFPHWFSKAEIQWTASTHGDTKQNTCTVLARNQRISHSTRQQSSWINPQLETLMMNYINSWIVNWVNNNKWRIVMDLYSSQQTKLLHTHVPLSWNTIIWY